MKTEFQTNRDEFLRLLTKCAQAANRKSTMPVLGNILVDVGADEVTLTSSDLTMVVTGSMPVSSTTTGGFLVPAKDFIDRVRAMPSGTPLTISNKELELTLKAKSSARRFKLHTLAKEDYPRVPQPDQDAEDITLPKVLLAELIAGTHYAISMDESRPHMAAALFELEQGRARMVATDGHRLAKRELSCDYSGVAKRALIPHRGVMVLRKLVEQAEDDETIKLHLGQFHLFAESGVSFGIKLNDGSFPPYQQVIPNVGATSPWVVNKGALADSIKAVGVSASSRTNGIKVELGDGKIVVSAESPEGGDGRDEVPCDGGSKKVTFGVSAAYLLDAISEVADAQVAILSAGPLDPVVIRAADGDAKCLDVIMPMRI